MILNFVTRITFNHNKKVKFTFQTNKNKKANANAKVKFNVLFSLSTFYSFAFIFYLIHLITTPTYIYLTSKIPHSKLIINFMYESINSITRVIIK